MRPRINLDQRNRHIGPALAIRRFRHGPGDRWFQRRNRSRAAPAVSKDHCSAPRFDLNHGAGMRCQSIFLARSGRRRGRSLARHQRGNTLHLESEVRRHGTVRGQAAEGNEGQERRAEEAPGRVDAGHGGADVLAIAASSTRARWRGLLQNGGARREARDSRASRRARRIAGANWKTVRYQPQRAARPSAQEPHSDQALANARWWLDFVRGRRACGRASVC